MKDEIILPEEMALASKVASYFSSRWKLVEREDLESHLFLWLVENVSHLENWRKEEGDGKLYVSLRREASKYCAKETKHKANTDDLNNGNFYNIDIVYKALPYIFEYDTISSEMKNEDSGLGYNIMADILNAYNGLNKENKDVLELRYHFGFSFEEIAESYGLTEKAAEKRVERAANKLLSSLYGTPLGWVPNESSKPPKEYY